jgi:hypothetical protein
MFFTRERYINAPKGLGAPVSNHAPEQTKAMYVYVRVVQPFGDVVTFLSAREVCACGGLGLGEAHALCWNPLQHWC